MFIGVVYVLCGLWECIFVFRCNNMFSGNCYVCKEVFVVGFRVVSEVEIFYEWYGFFLWIIVDLFVFVENKYFVELFINIVVSLVECNDCS